VIPCAASSLFQPVTDRTPIASILSKYAIDGRQPYFLYVGGLSPHKNLLRLIDAFAMLSERNAQLVLVGDLGDVFRTHVPELRARVKDRRLDGKVVFTGYVPDEDLVWLYNGALALVQPSLIEGFGLPPVEAMACGTPVIASTAGSLPEVVGDAGIAFEPTDVDALAEAMQRLIADYALRAEFACRATERAQSFRWSHAARQVLEVMSQAAMHQVAA
jgi:glycosyltransferase involved in cell wall biosynthesis